VAVRQRADDLDRHHDRHLLVLRAQVEGCSAATGSASCCCCWRHPGLVGVALDVQAGLTPIELAVFLVFIAEYRSSASSSTSRLGHRAVVVGIQVLQYSGCETRRASCCS
jgi:hypothetical protein